MDAKSTGRVARKIAIVTGAAGGLGRAIAVRLAEEGATLAIVDIDNAGLAETEQLIAVRAGQAMSIEADVTDEQAVKSLFSAVLAAHGQVDILVNNVGGGQSGRIWEAEVSDWDFVMRLNLRSAFLCTRAASAHMKERRSGRIVNLSSGSREGTPLDGVLCGKLSLCGSEGRDPWLHPERRP